ncbi:MAG TPA: FAD-dependent oxidoreductase [Terriglobales bacterium]|nr:FAD-dependent oxidoreductase [Terriglobales bacterium]
MKTRTAVLRELAVRRFDVCVIGGGATGAGCALEAQLRGLQTALVDAGDFASASSSASTKLVHGGVRYLQQALAELDLGQLKVVRRALRERILLLENAPYLAHPLEILIPCRHRFETLYYGLGMKLYERMAGRASLGPSRKLSPAESRRRMPGLAAEKLAGSVVYFDGQLDDARYGLTLVNTFVAAGGEAANYAKVIAFEKDSNGKLTVAILEDRLAGARLAVQARAFVNATGPFSDRIRSLASPGVVARLVLSRGVHILLPLEADATSEALLVPRTEDGRVIFAIPWQGRLLVGTTDRETTLEADLTVQQAEAGYLLSHLNPYLARPRGIQEIVSAFAGIRPLVRSNHARATRKLIRDHEVEVDPESGLISILGGKWTTYRAMGEDAVDAVGRYLGQAVLPSPTRHHRLEGGKAYRPDYWKDLVREFGLEEPVARHLAQKFGSGAAEVVFLTKTDPELRRSMVSGSAAIRAEIVHAIWREMAVTIEDVLARRLGLEYFSWELAVEAAPVVASYLARQLDWSEAQKNEAVSGYVGQIRRRQSAIGVRKEPPA